MGLLDILSVPVRYNIVLIVLIFFFITILLDVRSTRIPRFFYTCRVIGVSLKISIHRYRNPIELLKCEQFECIFAIQIDSLTYWPLKFVSVHKASASATFV